MEGLGLLVEVGGGGDWMASRGGGGLVSWRVEGGGVLDLHRLGDVEVLVLGLLGVLGVLGVLWVLGVLGVLGHRAMALGRGRLQHHHLGVAVGPGVVGARHGPLDVSLSYLPQGVGVGDALGSVNAVALQGVGGLGGGVSRGHVRRRGGRQGS